MRKRFYNYFFSVAVLFALFSCSKQLNEVPPNTLVADNAIRDETTAQTAIVGLYSFFGDYKEFDALMSTRQGVRLNILEPHNTWSYQLQWAMLDIEPSEGNVKTLWVYPFTFINAANNIIHQVENLTDDKFGPGRRAEMLAEARFMRGFGHLFIMKEFAHFWDVDSEFGPLLRLEPAGIVNNRKERSSVAEGYESILGDLKYASENLPVFSSVYKVSKELAQAFVVETLLMRGKSTDFSEAAGIAKDVIDNGPFRLETPFSNVYTSGYNSTELMFSRKINPENIGLNDLIVANISSRYNLLGRKQNAPSETFFNWVDTNDVRYPYIIGDTITAAGQELTNTWIKDFEVNGDLPMRYFSLTQLYLYYAEALLRSGASISEVLNPMNVLRERAGMPLFQESDFADRKFLEEKLFDELLMEIVADNGSEFFAAVRFRNSSGERMIQMFNPTFVSDDQLAFPIPDDELFFNSAMTPNP